MEYVINTDGSVSTISSLSECFMDEELYKSSTEEQKKMFQKDVLDLLNGAMRINANPSLSYNRN